MTPAHHSKHPCDQRGCDIAPIYVATQALDSAVCNLDPSSFRPRVHTSCCAADVPPVGGVMAPTIVFNPICPLIIPCLTSARHPRQGLPLSTKTLFLKINRDLRLSFSYPRLHPLALQPQFGKESRRIGMEEPNPLHARPRRRRPSWHVYVRIPLGIYDLATMVFLIYYSEKWNGVPDPWHDDGRTKQASDQVGMPLAAVRFPCGQRRLPGRS